MGLITIRCFLSTPFSEGFRPVRDAIVKALRASNVEVVLMEDLSASAQSLGEVLHDQIRAAHFVIADVTGGNPYVLYEVGLAQGMQKPVLLIAQDIDSAPPPLRTSSLILIYDPADLGRLQHAMVQWLMRLAPEAGAAR